MALQFWKEKTGPLPNWAWGGLGLGAAVAYSSWQRNRQAGKEEEEEATSTSGINMPDSIQPTYVFQDMDTTNITVPSAPAGGGRPPTPGPVTPPAPGQPRPPESPTRPLPHPNPPRPAPKPPAAPKGKYVTVAKWNAKKAPWNSTVWGIATHLLGPKASWQTVWNAPQNAALKKKRKDPTKIQPGDKIWVPGAK